MDENELKNNMSPNLFSVIIPVFNRPGEVDELLASLTNQTVKNFEVIIIEDGSQQKCDTIVEKYKELLSIYYYFKDNSGPGDTRNFGAQKANNSFVLFFDSDCIIPDKYFEHVTQVVSEKNIEIFGGPDMAHPDFTPIQKAINYTMTAFLTTGGIRGGKKKVDDFYPRSFNMGIKKDIFLKVNGFSKMRFGEDLDLSYRLKEGGHDLHLIRGAGVYHKRRTDFKKFFKQIFNSGIARINLQLLHPGTLKIVHAIPAAFIFGNLFLLILSLLNPLFLAPILLYSLAICFDSGMKNASIKVALLSVISAYVQHTAYGTGFIKAFFKRIVFGKSEFRAYSKNFYK